MLSDTEKIAIFGGAGGGVVVAQSVRNMYRTGSRISCIGFLNDSLPVGQFIDDLPVLGKFADWIELEHSVKFIAPLHKTGESSGRSRLIVDLGVPLDRWCNIVDPAVQLGERFTIGSGCAISPYVVAQPGAALGNHVAIRSGVIISHDTVISDFVFIGANACLCGHVFVEVGAHISPGAVIKEHTRVGKYSVIGLGAVVIDDVPDYAVVAGNPARIVRNLRV